MYTGANGLQIEIIPSLDVDDISVEVGIDGKIIIRDNLKLITEKYYGSSSLPTGCAHLDCKDLAVLSTVEVCINSDPVRSSLVMHAHSQAAAACKLAIRCMLERSGMVARTWACTCCSQPLLTLPLTALKLASQVKKSCRLQSSRTVLHHLTRSAL